MNLKNTPKSMRFALTAGLMLCGAAAASANSLVTFQVDMAWYQTYNLFDPSSQTMSVAGTFNNWTPAPMTNNPTSATSNIWSTTINIPTNGVSIGFKYVIEPGATFENSHNRWLLLPSTSGGSVTTPAAYYAATSDPFTNTVTFQVDMAQQINTGAFVPGTSSVYTLGGFDGWAAGNTTPMTNDPTILRTNQFGLVTSNVYVATFDIGGAPGQDMEYKFYIDTGANWESPNPATSDYLDNNNRFMALTTTSNASVSVPIIFFNDLAYSPVATNYTTFQVDMTAQIINGSYNPANGDVVELRGNFNSWGNPQILCTNDLTAANTNIYKTVVKLVDGIGATEQYKFWATNESNGGWETMANNRTMKIISGTNNVLPLVFFNNVDPGDLLPADTLVTFTVNMTNAVGTDAHAFDPTVDQVFINGVPNGFAAWNIGLPMLTNNPVGSELYSVQILVPKNSPVGQIYKYSINGTDNEGPSGANHTRYIRSTTTGTYEMPLDVFSSSPPVEPSFGNLTATRGTAGHATVSFLGRPGVHLQSAASLNPPVVWQDHPETDGGNWTGTLSPSSNGLVTGTNVSTANGYSFFRLLKQ